MGEESNVPFYWGSLSSLLNHAGTSEVLCASWNGGRKWPDIHSGQHYQYPSICSYVLHLTPGPSFCQALLLDLHVRMLTGSLPTWPWDAVQPPHFLLPTPHFLKHTHMISQALGIQPLGKGQVCLPLVAPVSILSSFGQSFLKYCLVNFSLRATETSL